MKRHPHSSPAGFTLIEVVMSIGLLAFAIMVIMSALGTAAHYASNDARRTLAVDLLHRSFTDLGLVNKPGTQRSPTLGLGPLTWGSSPSKLQVWFDAGGNVVTTQSKAFYRCDLTATRDERGAVGHLHGRILWPVRQSGRGVDGTAELFTSMSLP